MKSKLNTYTIDSLISKTILISDIKFYNVVINLLGTDEFELNCDLRRNGSSFIPELPRKFKSIRAAKEYSNRLFGDCVWTLFDD